MNKNRKSSFDSTCKNSLLQRFFEGNETLTEHPEGTLSGVARYSKASLLLFIFDEAEFSSQVRRRFCWMVSPQQRPPAGAAAPRAYMERGEDLSSRRPPGRDVLLMTDGVQQPGHLQLNNKGELLTGRSVQVVSCSQSPSAPRALLPSAPTEGRRAETGLSCFPFLHFIWFMDSFQLLKRKPAHEVSSWS